MAQQRRGNRGGKGEEQAIHKFVLGTKELDDKTAEFQYDKGWYNITDIVGEERTVVYHSKNMAEAYTKWNVYIGRKKERMTPEERKKQREEQKERVAQAEAVRNAKNNAANTANNASNNSANNANSVRGGK